MNDLLKYAQELSTQEEWDEAYLIADKHLREDPNNVDWLMLMVYIMLGTHKHTIAYQLAKRCLELSPRDPSMYLNFGMAANELWRKRESERVYKKGMALSKTAEQLHGFLVNMTGLLIDNGRFDEARKLCEQAIELGIESVKPVANLGFCQIANGEWEEGWKNYRSCIGTEFRPKTTYGDEPEWDGESKGTIVAYAEQGLGDQICFASMIPDMQRWCDENDSTFIVETDIRLAMLFKRSFPATTIYGTAGQSHLDWKPEHRDIDYSIPLGQLGEYFRTKDSDFPRTPFLAPDPDREYMWRKLFTEKKKPAIGIAWTGGVPKTGSHLKKLDLEQLKPLFESIDAHWVSLQYKPAGAEIAEIQGVDIAQYPYATLSKDYDATAALVSALDAVVAVPTSVVHLAGALGVRTIAMCGPVKCWKYSAGNPFHPITAMIEHSRDWNSTIKETASHLEDLCLTTESLSDSIPDSLSPITSVNTQSSPTLQSQSA